MEDNSTASLEDEGEEHDSVTVDQLLSSVLKTKSLLGDRIRFTLPVSKSRYDDNGSTPFMRKPTGNSSDPSSRIQQIPLYTPKDGKKLAVDSGRILLASNQKNNLGQSNHLHRYPQSNSKFSRSVSTPEINLKFVDASGPKKSEKVYRKVDFTDGGKENCKEMVEKPDEDDKHSESIFLKEFMLETQRLHSSGFRSGKDSNNFLSNSTDFEKSKSCSLSNIKMPNNCTNFRNEHATPLSERLKFNENVKKNNLTEPSHLAECKQPRILHKLPESISRTPKINILNKENINRPSLKTPTTTESRRKEERVLLGEPVESMSEFKTPISRIPQTVPEPSPALNLGLNDIIVVKGLNYLKLKDFGKGGSSVVHEVLDLQSKERKAIKIVNLEHEEPTTRTSYKNEVQILKRLQYSNRVIKLYDHEETANHLKIVMEAGDIDLAKILSEARRNKANPISAFSIKHYWQGMLLAVQVIHDEGIIHSDLKPANFLLVNHTLKLIDFGIASSVQQDMTSVFKDNQSGTYNYMSPESLNDVNSGPIINLKVQDKATIKISVKSDVWSLGCILYNLVYGKTPFQHIMNPLQKLAAISSYRTTISFPPVNDRHLLDVMQKCLQFDPKMRPSIQSLLRHPYLEGGLSLTSSKASKVQSPSFVPETGRNS